MWQFAEFCMPVLEPCHSRLTSGTDFTSSFPIDSINSAFKRSDITVFLRNVLTHAKIEKHLSHSERSLVVLQCFQQFRCFTKYYFHIIISYTLLTGSRVSAVGIATGYGLDDRGVGVRVPVGSRIFTSPCRPDRLWSSPNLLSNGYRG
jgi:hypothetical protein